jgi:hypothetical protein
MGVQVVVVTAGLDASPLVLECGWSLHLETLRSRRDVECWCARVAWACVVCGWSAQATIFTVRRYARATTSLCLCVPACLWQIPAHKVKLVVGPGGEKIKWIQRKSKCRIQVGGARAVCVCVGAGLGVVAAPSKWVIAGY